MVVTVLLLATLLHLWPLRCYYSRPSMIVLVLYVAFWDVWVYLEMRKSSVRVCVCTYIYILYYIYSVFDMPSIHVCSKWFLLQSCLDINVLYIASDRHCLKLRFHISNQHYRITQDKATAEGSSLLIAELLALSELVGFLLAGRSTVWNHRNVQRDQHHQPRRG